MGKASPPGGNKPSWPPYMRDTWGDKSENNDLIMRSSLSKLLPANLKSAAQVVVGMPLKFGSADLPSSKESTWNGVYGQFTSNNANDNTALVSRRASDYGSTLMHEIGHAVWLKGDIDQSVADKWTKLHNARLNTHRYGTRQSTLANSDDPVMSNIRAAQANRRGLNTEEARRDDAIHPAIRFYADDPSHSFAEIFGQYVANPARLLARSPVDYNFMKRWVFKGREYLNTSGVPPAPSSR